MAVLVACLLWVLQFAAAQAPQKQEHHRYCIIGAGPGGVQLGHYLHTHSRDYVLLDRAPRAASWFSKFPVHRQLNSINRRQTRSGNAEFNLRHDWNSLLDSPADVPLFREWSKEYWPPADTIVEYINAFAAPQIKAGTLQFNQLVSSVSKCNVESQPAGPCRYVLAVNKGDPQERRITCSVLVMANGMEQPRVVKDWYLDLEKVQTTYDNLAGVDISHFENRSVLILGTGNAAAETADAVRNVVRDIQVIGRYSDHKLMRETHYVGDLRGRRTTHLDAFNLKSYEGAISIQESNLVMVPCGPDEDNKGFMGRPPVCTFELLENLEGAEGAERYAVLCSLEDPDKALVDEAFELFGDDLTMSPPTELQRREKIFARRMNVSYVPALSQMLLLPLKVLRSELSHAQRKLLIRLRLLSIELTKTGEEFQYPYDVVVAATGWKYNKTILEAGGLELAMIGPPSRKQESELQVYPELNSEFESTNLKHLFVAGAAAHGPDRYRYKASGGFIHGFRFNVRTLWRILEDRYESTHPAGSLRVRHGVTEYAWDVADRPTAIPKEFSDMNGRPNKLKPMYKHIFNRINEAAGPYEMVGGSLQDTIVFDGKRGKAWFLEDTTEDYVHERYLEYPRLTWAFHYGVWHGPLGPPAQSVCQLRTVSSGIFSNYIHPVLQYFPPNVQPEGQTDKYQWLLGHGRQDGSMSPKEHPSTVFTTPTGVSRVHVKEAYIFLDWKDTTVVQLIEFFMGHVEHAAASFFAGKGNGAMNQTFDEQTDIRFYDTDFQDQYRQLYQESCHPNQAQELKALEEEGIGQSDPGKVDL